jgi:CBS domain-containing protein
VKPVMTIPADLEIAHAIARLDRSHVSGLAVVDDHGFPIGMFTQIEALYGRDLPPRTKVDELMSYSILTQHPKLPVFRAAAHAYETRARRVLVMEDRALVGVVTGLDFARTLAGSAA